MPRACQAYRLYMCVSLTSSDHAYLHSQWLCMCPSLTGSSLPHSPHAMSFPTSKSSSLTLSSPPCIPISHTRNSGSSSLLAGGSL